MEEQPFGELTEWKHVPLDHQATAIEGGKLWGRGSSEDCYAFYSAILAVKACQEHQVQHLESLLLLRARKRVRNFNTT